MLGCVAEMNQNQSLIWAHFTMSTTLAHEINGRVFEIVHEAATHGVYASSHLVMSTLLSRYAVFSFEQLGINPNEIPSLQYLLKLNQQVSVFLDCYLLEHSIVALHDVEKDLCAFLRSFNLHSMMSIDPSLGKEADTSGAVDPNEIDLDDAAPSAPSNDAQQPKSVVQQRCQIIIQFDDLGIGPLHQHPQLQPYLSSYVRRPSSDASSSVDVTLSDCMQLLLPMLDSDDDSAEAFHHLLSQHFQVAHLGELGVFIQPHTFPSLCTRLRDVAAASTRWQQESVMTYLEEQAKQEALLSWQSKGEKRVEKKVLVQSLSLKEPAQDAALKNVHQRMKDHFAQKSAFAPTFSAIRDYLSSTIAKEKTSSKQRRKATVPEEDTETWDVHAAIVEAATEYFFLHFGSKRDISKRFILSEDAENYIAPMENSKGIDDTVVVEPAVHNETTGDAAMDTSGEPAANASSNTSSVDPFIPLEMKRSIVHRRLPTSIADEAASMILEIPNDQLQEILQSLHVPPLPPASASGTTATGHVGRPSSQEFLISQEVGRLGECLVYQYLKSRLEQTSPSSKATYRVQWLNDVEDSRAPYDLVVDPATSSGSLSGRIFVEVKSSRYDDNNVFQLTLWEWEFLRQQPAVQYHVYRVFSVLDKRKTRIVVLTNVRRLVEMGRIQLCLSI